MHFTIAQAAVILGLTVASYAQGPCGAPRSDTCDSGDCAGQDLYVPGTCSPDDTGICTINGIQKACAVVDDPVFGMHGGGNCETSCYFFTGTMGGGVLDPQEGYTTCC